jgi:acyl carrier protein
MNFNDFLEGLVVALDLPDVKELNPDVPFTKLPDYDSLATLGVMTFAEIEFNKQIEGQWIWDNEITPKQLFDHLNG